MKFVRVSSHPPPVRKKICAFQSVKSTDADQSQNMAKIKNVLSTKQERSKSNFTPNFSGFDSKRIEAGEIERFVLKNFILNTKKEVLLEKMNFPARLVGYGACVEINLPRPMEGNAKVFLRDVAKSMADYHQKIETGICGRTDAGQAIPIDSVGKWLFGTPGYMGHIRVSNWEGTIAVVEFPDDSPMIVFGLITEIKMMIESGRVSAEIMRRWNRFFDETGM